MRIWWGTQQFIYINLGLPARRRERKKGLHLTQLYQGRGGGGGGSSQNYYGRDLAPHRGGEGREGPTAGVSLEKGIWGEIAQVFEIQGLQ
jgi:hypothetical protein